LVRRLPCSFRMPVNRAEGIGIVRERKGGKMGSFGSPIMFEHSRGSIGMRVRSPGGTLSPMGRGNYASTRPNRDGKRRTNQPLPEGAPAPLAVVLNPLPN
jgi:hypothetical protein